MFCKESDMFIFLYRSYKDCSGHFHQLIIVHDEVCFILGTGGEKFPTSVPDPQIQWTELCDALLDKQNIMSLHMELHQGTYKK